MSNKKRRILERAARRMECLMGLNDELRELAATDLFGVAGVSSYDRAAPVGHRASELLEDARSVVLLGRRMLDLPLDRLPITRAEYTANFHIVNASLNDKLYVLARRLEDLGFKAYPIPYREMPGWNLEKRHAGAISVLRPLIRVPMVHDRVNAMLWENLSYRHLAAEAGLGTLGVSNLLLTPEHGARVRFVALVTDAPLEAGKPLAKSPCQPEKCGHACVRACPAGALSEDGSPTDKARCLKYYIKLGIPGQSGVRCGLCIAKCPANRSSFSS